MAEFEYGWVSVPIKDVMKDPKKYIIPENLAAISYLWDMNILTEQTNNYDNEDSWIAIGMLSEENLKIFSDMYNSKEKWHDESAPGILNHHGWGFRVPVKPGTKDTLEDFLPLFKMLKFQDVQRDGYMTIDEFYSKYTDCYKTIRNPYYDLLYPIDSASVREALRVFDIEGYPETPKVRVFDKTKAINTAVETD